MPILSSLSSASARSYGLTLSGSKLFFLNSTTRIFLGSQDFTIPAGITQIDYLIVAGGGGGGGLGGFGGFGAGGGGGGYRTGSGYIVNPGSTYTITVGAGGGQNGFGSNSGIRNVSTSIWSSGGGCGGCAAQLGGNTNPPGKPGGSGGGATKKDTDNSLGTAGQGNFEGPTGVFTGTQTGVQQGYGGGSAFTAGHPSPGANGSGGGGGASANGTSASSGVSGRGGAGLASTIAGYPIAFSGGGGGYSDTAPNIGNGGAGGGGNASSTGTVNSGGGGGGGGNSVSGGSGIVILKYSQYQNFNANVVIQQFANTNSYTMPDGVYWSNATLVSGLYGRRYNGYFADVPTFFNTAAFSGTSKVYTNINSNWSEGGDNFSVEWLGYFKPNSTGTWTFETISDDASYLWIGSFAVGGYTTGNATVNNGGAHGDTSRTGTASLIAGVYYPIRVQFGESGGGERMTVNFTPPGGASTNDGTGYYFYNSNNLGI